MTEKERKERSLSQMVERDKGIPVWMVFVLMAQTDHFYMEVALE